MSIGTKRKATLGSAFLAIDEPPLIKPPLHSSILYNNPSNYLSSPKSLQLWTSALVVLPVFLQAPWARLHPFSACLFTFVILTTGLLLGLVGGKRWSNTGSMLVGVSGSWLGGCLFWGWLRAHPLLHLPIEAFALPLALGGLTTKWRIGSSFYLACLFGTACTDIMMLLTGVIEKWPIVVQAPITLAPELLHQTAKDLLHIKPIIMLILATLLITFIAHNLSNRAVNQSISDHSWIVASTAIKTTLWVDGIFLLTALLEPNISGLI